MYKVGFLNCSAEFQDFENGLRDSLDYYEFKLSVFSFTLEEAFSIDFEDFDIFIVSVDDVNYADLEVYLNNLRFCYSGVLIVLDVRNSMHRRMVLDQLGIDLYFYLPVKDYSFVRFFPWMIKAAGRSKNLVYGDMRLDLNTRSLMRGQKKYFLKNMEFRLMEYLMRNNRKILSRVQILEDVWDMNAFTDSKTLEVHICKLRQKIDKGFDRKLLHTIPNTGYMLK